MTPSALLLRPARMLAVLLPALSACAAPGATPEPGVQQQIARVEADLRPAVQVRGRSYPGGTLEERMRHHGVPAVSIAVIHEGRIQWARAYGLADVETQRPATPTTLFQAASISKPVAGMAALSLVQDGQLELDADVNQRLVSWRVPANELTARRPVTLRGLMTHTAGLTVHGFPGYAAGKAIPSVVQVLDGAAPANTAPVRVDLEPGTRWRYSGGGTTVMQLLLTDATGKPFPQLMRERVLEPLGMTASTFEQPLPAGRADQAATGYRAGGKAVEGRYHTYPEMAAAGLWTTPTDLARWMLEVQRAVRGEGRVLRRETAQAMLTAGLGGYGLGPAVQGAGDSLRFSHGGANEGFRGQLVAFAHQGSGVAILTNSDTGGPLAAELLQSVARAYGWQGFTPREIVPVPIAAATLAELAGRYRQEPSGATFRVEAGEESLWVILPGGERLELVPVGADRFAAATGAGTVQVERDAQGRVVALQSSAGRLQRLP